MPLDQENTFQDNKTTWKKLRNGNIGLTKDDIILQVNIPYCFVNFCDNNIVQGDRCFSNIYIYVHIRKID